MAARGALAGRGAAGCGARYSDSGSGNPGASRISMCMLCRLLKFLLFMSWFITICMVNAVLLRVGNDSLQSSSQ